MIGGLVGWIVLTLLTALAALNALGLAVRSEPSGRAELGVIASAAFFGQLVAPVFVLGYAGVLTPTGIGLAATLSFLVVFALLVRGRSWRTYLRECAQAFESLARLPSRRSARHCGREASSRSGCSMRA